MMTWTTCACKTDMAGASQGIAEQRRSGGRPPGSEGRAPDARYRSRAGHSLGRPPCDPVAVILPADVYLVRRQHASNLVGRVPGGAQAEGSGRYDVDLRYRRARSSLFLHRMAVGTHTQAGVVGLVPAHAFTSRLVLPHERTLPERPGQARRDPAEPRSRWPPVLLTHRASADVTVLARRVARRPPTLECTSPDGVAHTVWQVDDPPEVEELIAAMRGAGPAYLIDGHHRVATTLSLGPSDAVLCYLLPSDQLRLLPHHRVVSDWVPAVGDVIAALRHEFEVAVVRGPRLPTAPGEVLLSAGAGWLRARPRPPWPEALVAVRVAEQILGVLLGTGDAEHDPGVLFVPGTATLSELNDQAHRARGTALTFTALTTSELMEAADAGRLLPAKASWAEPKPPTGLYLRPGAEADVTGRTADNGRA
ncbi:MAG: DUF1015 family protein [Acidimicrobiia bacterium]|nr:DUF1015 family protein [Acidimicrobiia bacterium]